MSSGESTKRPQNLPKFSDLPLSKNDPPFSAWGLYGPDDELGTLNRLTDEIVKEAASEIRSGVRIPLDWPMDAQGAETMFGRHSFHKELIHKAPRAVNDDVWTFNSQCSSQWDGLRHFAYQSTKQFYNNTTLSDIHNPSTSSKPENYLGVQAQSRRGITGRAVLLDYHSWRLANRPDLTHEAFEQSNITLEHLKEVAKAQNTTLKFGDILLIRSGFMVAYAELSDERKSQIAALRPPKFCGVEQSEEVLEWIWDHFAAVGGDQPAFECYPSKKEFMMHEVLLAGWGMPIGELFDLEALAKHCKEVGRWEFFIASKACDVPGGIASPPNAMAIF